MKKILLGVVSAFLLIFIACTIYVQVGTAIKKDSLLEHLESKGSSEAEIHNIEIKHLFLHRFSDYYEWRAIVEFEDEQGVLYEYSFNEKKEISQGTFLHAEAVYGHVEKEELLELLKHLER